MQGCAKTCFRIPFVRRPSFRVSLGDCFGNLHSFQRRLPMHTHTLTYVYNRATGSLLPSWTSISGRRRRRGGCCAARRRDTEIGVDNLPGRTETKRRNKHHSLAAFLLLRELFGKKHSHTQTNHRISAGPALTLLGVGLAWSRLRIRCTMVDE